MKLMGIVWSRLEWVGGGLIYLSKSLCRPSRGIPLAQQCRDTSWPCLPPVSEVSRYPGTLREVSGYPEGAKCQYGDYFGMIILDVGVDPWHQGGSQTPGRGWLESSVCRRPGPRHRRGRYVVKQQLRIFWRRCGHPVEAVAITRLRHFIRISVRSSVLFSCLQK